MSNFSVLAIESSSRQISVALARPGQPTLDAVIPPGMGSSAQLIPTLQRLLNTSDFRPKESDVLAVSLGPGSFTGLRVGVVAAKTLAYAWRCRLLGVETPRLIAFQGALALSPRDRQTIWTIQDAQRGEFFLCCFDWSNGRLQQVEPTRIAARHEVLGAVHAGHWVNGPGLDGLYADLQERGVHLADKALWTPAARALTQWVVESGWESSSAAGSLDPAVWTLEPIYLRPSAAEERRLPAPPDRDQYR